MDTYVAATLKRNGNRWEAKKYFWTSKGRTKVLQTRREPKDIWNKDKNCRRSFSVSPSLIPSRISDIGMRWHSYTSQAGDRTLVRSELYKSSPIAKGWEINPDLFILPYAAILKYLTDARMQFLSFGTCFAVEQVKEKKKSSDALKEILYELVYTDDCSPNEYI